MDSDEDDFGPTVPPLSVYIRGILQRYPDGSQLKELLQNAEDAGASVIKFIYDGRSYNQQGLHLPNLSHCQGPSLCAYNDAKFEPCDWKGIQQPQRSHKADSILKVGKFGIGFNSVYHLTDVPWILSGEKLAVIEPTESLLNGQIRGVVKHRSGFHWILNKKEHQREVDNYPNQFVPIKIAAQVANTVGLSKSWDFNGTLFRLPLRTAESTISSTIYNESMVDELFRSFTAETSEILLFLLELECVQLLKLNSQGALTVVDSVKISENCLERVRETRNDVRNSINKIVDLRKMDKVVTNDVTANMILEIKEYLEGVDDRTWIVSHFLPKHSIAPKSWALEKLVKRLPWVSLAAVVDQSIVTEGRTFCFLPLPNNQENMTGLPVHVNAYFGLEDNRRNLKWPSTDQTRDIDALWNNALLEEVIPTAYVQLIRYCIEIYGEKSYNLWPNPDQVHHRWKTILSPFFILLFKQPVLKVSCPGGTWSVLNKDTYVDNLAEYCEETIAEAVRRCLNVVRTPYVHVPDNVLAGVTFHFDPKRINYITYTIVRNQLVKNPRCWTNITVRDRLLLLQYFVESTPTAISTLSLIKDLPIIPLANGSFGAIENQLYLASEDYIKLLPTLTNSIINLQDLPKSVLTFFNEVADYQVRLGITRINKHNFPSLLRNALPSAWKCGTSIQVNLNTTTFPNNEWLQALWAHLAVNYPLDLSSFEGLALIESNHPLLASTLLVLPQRNASLLFVAGSFTANIERLLLASRATAVPKTVLQKHADLVNYIHQGNVTNLTNLLQNCDLKAVNDTLTSNADMRNELVKFIAEQIDYITPDGKALLKQMSLFEILRYPRRKVVNQNVISVNTCNINWRDAIAITFSGLPENITPNVPYLDCTKRVYNTVRKCLTIRAMTEEEVANDIIENRNSYNSQIFSLLMIWAFGYIHPHKVRSSLTNHNFVPTGNGQICSPAQLFDPQVQVLVHLFDGEGGRFPVRPYNDRRTVEILRVFGLRSTLNDLTADEILQTARSIDKNHPSQVKIDCFNQVIHTQLNKLSHLQRTQLQSLKLFQAAKTRPRGYPQSLTWFGSDKSSILYTANQMGKGDCALIAGSVIPTVEIDVPLELGFATAGNINANCVIRHLLNISCSHSLVNKFELLNMLNECYKVIAGKGHLEIQKQLRECNWTKWVWTGNGFADPSEVVTNWTYYKAGLEPYMYCLPTFLIEESTLQFFRDMGVQTDDGYNVGVKVLGKIKKKHEKCASVANEELKTDFNYVRSILEVIANNFTNIGDIEVPIKHSKQKLTFRLASECKFNDSSIHGTMEFDDDDDDDDDEIILTHSDLPNELCLKLGAKPLSNEMLDAEEYEQHESMLQRLRNILKDYPAGATIFQELIQNAEDAGASEVGFLLDMRENSQWRKSVMWNGLDKFQGPALWVFNNATFTDDDFKNLLSVGGATKSGNAEKIGSFGVGFNCVYHLTDIPCFVSRQYLAMLDPHNRCLPRTAGIRYNLGMKPKKLEVFAHQFLPYKDVFGCDLSYDRAGASYPNTLFRLPLRDSNMARDSQLSTVSYDLLKMQDLLKTFALTGEYSNLFLQKVKKVELNYVASNSSPRDKQTPLIIEKKIRQLRKTDSDPGSLTLTVKSNISSNRRSVALHSTKWIDMSLTYSSNALSLGRENGTIRKLWIQQWSTSEGKAYELASSAEGQNAGLMPVVAIAASVTRKGAKGIIDHTAGLAFCYLPLPVDTGLPFHLHAPFALAANRRHLWKENARDLSNLETRWNEALKTEALVTCFIKLLDALKSLEDYLEDYKFCSIWPICEKVNADFCGFVKSVYQQLGSSDTCLWKSVEGEWISFHQSRFLLLSNQWPQNFHLLATRTMQNVFSMSTSNSHLVEIPPELSKTLDSLYQCNFTDKTLNDEKFFTIFFSFINMSTDHSLSNEILLEVLKNPEAQKPYLRRLLQESPCIPVTADGKVRVRPRDLIDKNSEIHELYFEKEHKFAFGPFQDQEIRRKLVALGMQTCASGEMLLERAKTVTTLYDGKLIAEAKRRSELILNNLTGPNISDSMYDTFLDIPFVFALAKPEDWSLQCQWFNTNSKTPILYSPNQLYSNRDKNAICCVAPIIDVKNVQNGQKLEYQIRCSHRYPPANLIFEQLEILSKLSLQKFTPHQFEMVQSMILDCFWILEKNANPSFTISGSPVLLFKPAAYVPYIHICTNSLQENYAPYLYSIKGTPYDKYADLLRQFGIRESFTLEDYIGALQRIGEKFGKNRMPKDVLQITVHLCRRIFDFLARGGDQPEQELSIPDELGRLTPVSRLIFWELDMTEIPKELLEDVQLSNRDIPRDVALKLGVRLQRVMVAEKFYRSFEGGESFGQHEELTTRISNILDEYSSKSDVINEMIQNADDAGASEIRFILDLRQLPTDTPMLSDNWPELQGPALIVYNNKPFEKKDYEGIKNLGLGSKRTDPNLTGKFGIGFNTVYHLTDVPMFISNNKTLCVLDPHRKYAPTATSNAPGGIFELEDHFRRVYEGILEGFKPVQDLKFEEATVFRLPLRRRAQKIPSQISDSIDLKDFQQIFSEFESKAGNYFFFLKNVEKIGISYVNREGKLIRDVWFIAEMSNEDRKRKENFSKTVAQNEDEMVRYKMTISSNLKIDPKSNKPDKISWQIFQRLSCMKHEIPAEVGQLMETSKLTAKPLVGIAMPLHKNTDHRFTYTTLPLPGSNKLPIHVNGKFMLDQGRKHCYLDGESYKKQWNEYLITKVLAPLYIEALKFLKNIVSNDWTKTHSNGNDFQFQNALIRKYKHYLPTTYAKDILERFLLHEVYRLLHKNELQLTFGIKLDYDCYFKRNLMWLSPTEGIIDTLKNEEKTATASVRLSTGVTSSIRVPVKDNKPSEVDYIRNMLEIVHFPRFHLDFNSVVSEIFSVVDAKPNEITSQRVIEHMKKVDDKLILQSDEEKLPANLNNTILNDCINQLKHCLSYVLEAENADLQDVPLLLTKDFKLRRFSANYEVYPIIYSELLPSQGHLFCIFNFSKIPEKFCRKFDVPILAKYLPNELPELFGDCLRKPECNQNQLHLVYNILRYLADTDYEGENARQSLALRVQPLRNCALLPVISTNIEENMRKKFLLTLKYASLVIFRVADTKSDKAKQLYLCLEKMGVMFVSGCIYQYFEAIPTSNLTNFFMHLCACLKAPETIVNLLHAICTNKVENTSFRFIKKCEKSLLLEFIIENYSHEVKPNEVEVMKMIKQLPLFQTLEGNFVNLAAKYNYQVCKERIEGADLDKLQETNNLVLLSSKLSEHDVFCKNLGLSPTSKMELYSNYIIPNMANFSRIAILKHLNCLRNFSYGEDRDKLYKLVGQTKFVQMASGKFKAISDLYEETIKTDFESMLPEDSFLPEHFYKLPEDMAVEPYYWLSFLRQLGLQYELSHNVFLQLARNLKAEEGNSDDETLEAKSKILVKYLHSNYPRMVKDSKHFLDDVSCIEFVYPHHVCDNLNFLHVQSPDLKGLICYRGNVCWSKQQICWTVSKLLPDWSLSCFINKSLKYLDSPSADDVVKHAENICDRLQKLKFQEKTTTKINSSHAIELLKTILEEILMFLKNNLENKHQHLVDRLRNVPCVLVEEGRLLVCANQVVLQTFIECPPFLYVLPRNLYGVLDVLEKIGTEKNITHRHYSSALKMFLTVYGAGPYKDPNLKQSLQRAYIGFLIEIIHVEAKDITEEELYLPDHNFSLQRSTEIFVFADNFDIESFDDKPVKKWNTDMIKHLDMPIDKFAHALLKLPTLIRPKDYSHFVTTELTADCEMCAGEDFCKDKYDIEKLLRKHLFARVITKIINRFSFHLDNMEAKQDEMAAFFNDVKVVCYKILKVSKKDKNTNEVIKEETVPLFWAKTRDNNVEILVAHEHSDMKNKFVDILLKLVSLVSPFKTENDELHFRSIIDKLDLYRQDESLNDIVKRELKEGDVEDDVLPRLGSFLPDDVVAILDQNPFYYYKEGDFVALSTGDETDENEECYIYARIIEKIETDEQGILTCNYRIDIGDSKPVVNKTLDLYKFVDQKQLKRDIADEMALVYVENPENQGESQVPNIFSRPIEDILDQISDQVEEIWRLPEADRRRAIRRMYLQWHPDKHPADRRDICEEACKHLQNEIGRLEKGLPRPKKTEEKPETKPSNYWRQNFNRWNNRANRDGRRRRNYNQRARDNWQHFSSHRNSDVPPTYAKSLNPAAKHWCEQAKCDLATALKLLEGAKPCYEWVFYICYQVARKCLIAMLFTKSTYENQNTNLMELTADVLMAFGEDPGNVSDLVKLMVSKEVDETRPLKPLFGKTNHQNYQQCSDCCGDVVEAAKKLLKVAQRYTQQCENEE